MSEELKSNLFYSDPITFNVTTPFRVNTSVVLETYVSSLKSHLSVITDWLSNNSNIQNKLLQLTVTGDSIVGILNGQVPWSEEKIQEYEATVAKADKEKVVDDSSKEVDEVELLKSLIEKHPKLAFKLATKQLTDD